MKEFLDDLKKHLKRLLMWVLLILLIATVCFIFGEFAPSARVKLPNFFWFVDKVYAVLDWLLGLLRQLVCWFGQLFGQTWQ